MMTKAMNHRYMRLMLCLILSALSLACMFSLSNNKTANALDEEIPQITVEDKTVHRGQTFSVDISISNNIGLTSLMLSIDYDSNAMVLKNVIQKEALSTLTLTTTNTDTIEGYSVRPFNILWDGKDRDYSNGTIVTLIFDSYLDAPVGEYSISVTYNEENTNAQYMVPTPVEINGGTINLITGEFEVIYKDYNGDVIFRKDYNTESQMPDQSTIPHPTREEDAEYKYEFIGYVGEVSNDPNVLIYVAEYRLIPKEYTIFFYVDGIDNDYFDGKIDYHDKLDQYDVAFGSLIESPVVPNKEFYVFSGWYLDPEFKNLSTYALMPSLELSLYGYYKFEIRERDVPIIQMNSSYLNNGYEDVLVTVNIVKNTGFNAFTLALDYDRSALQYDHFESSGGLSQIYTTNLENESVDVLNFNYDSATNNYETGELLEIYFKVKPNTPNGNYDVTFTYDYHNGMTYITGQGESKETKYSMVDIIGTVVPVGYIDYWENSLTEERKVEVRSETGKPINVVMEVELITEKVSYSTETIEKTVGKNMYMSSAYKITLKQNDVVIEPDTNLVIRIKLTSEEQKGKIKLCYVDENGELVDVECEIENGYIVFKTDKLHDYLIFTSKAHARTLFNLGFPIVLAIATMLYAFNLKKQNKKKEEVQNE